MDFHFKKMLLKIMICKMLAIVLSKKHPWTTQYNMNNE